MAPQAMVMNIIGQMKPRLSVPSARLNRGMVTVSPWKPQLKSDTIIRPMPP